MGPWWILLAVGAGQLGPYPDGTVALTSSVASENTRRPARLLTSFLRDRIFETYGFSAGVEPTTETRLSVRLFFAEDGGVAITVLEGRSIRAARQLEAQAAESLWFESWIFLRATLEEVLPPPELSEPPPIPETPPIATLPVTPTASVAASPATRAEALTTTTGPGPAVQPSGVAMAALAVGALGGSEGLGLGVAVQGRMAIGERLTGTVELAYRRVDPLASLSVAHVPMSVLLGYQLDPSLPLELGARATLDPRLLLESNGGSISAGLGLGAGPYARVALPFESVAFVGQLDVQLGLLRQAYASGAQREVDPLLSVQVALGVEYQWP